MVTGLTDASIRFSARIGGATNPLILKGQIVNIDEPTQERDTINYTGSGITTEIIETVLQPMQVTYTYAGWNDALLELVENPEAVMEVERWLRAVSGELVTTGKRIAATWEPAGGSEPGWNYTRTRYTGPFYDPRIDAGEQGTAIANRIMVQRVNRLERFNVLGGCWRYIDVQTGENLIAPVGSRQSRTATGKEGLVALH